MSIRRMKQNIEVVNVEACNEVVAELELDSRWIVFLRGFEGDEGKEIDWKVF